MTGEWEELGWSSASSWRWHRSHLWLFDRKFLRGKAFLVKVVKSEKDHWSSQVELDTMVKLCLPGQANDD